MAEPFYGPQLPAADEHQAPGLQRIDERAEHEDASGVYQANDEGASSKLHPATLSFGPDLQRFDRLELNSVSGHENSQVHDSAGKMSALQRSRSKRIAKTKPKLQPPTKKLDFDEK